jgi:hypothetical protein
MSDAPIDYNDPAVMRAVLVKIDRDRAETQKLFAEAGKLNRDRQLAPAALVISGLTAGAALFAAGAAFVKVFG